MVNVIELDGHEKNEGVEVIKGHSNIISNQISFIQYSNTTSHFLGSVFSIRFEKDYFLISGSKKKHSWDIVSPDPGALQGRRAAHSWLQELDA